MNLEPEILLFVAGLVAGLILPVFLKLLHIQIVTDFLAAVSKGIKAFFSSLGHLFRKREKPKAPEKISEPKVEPAPKVDPREQQLSDSAQVVRAILLNLTGLIQRTQQAAQTSSTTLGDVRTNIQEMTLPPDLGKVHDLLLREIDRVISSNSTLKGELARSKDVLEVQRQQIESLKTAVRVDFLTQLANRAYFDEKLAEMIRLRNRYNDSFSVMMIDVDKFKTINDTYGHQAGDRILKGVAFKLKAIIRESDFLARIGGDEFVVILIKIRGPEAEELGWKLCRQLQESRFLLDGIDFNLTISVGIAEAVAGDTPEALIKRADKALYVAKEKGRNCAAMTPPPGTNGRPHP